MNKAFKRGEIIEIFNKQKQFYSTGKTKPIQYRKNQLLSLRGAIKDNEKTILDALYDDLRKPPFEAYITEVGAVLEDLKEAIEYGFHVD
jgi:aldehyde dehydrogenase (NAD+)